MRPIAVPFVVAPPSGARVRTRLRLGGADERVLRAVGGHLGRLAGAAVAVRCRLGGGDDRRADRKRALTAAASSRWAGAITRTSNDQWRRADANLRDARVGCAARAVGSGRGFRFRLASATTRSEGMPRRRSGSPSRAACSTSRPGSLR